MMGEELITHLGAEYYDWDPRTAPPASVRLTRRTSTCCGSGHVLCQKPASEPFPPIRAGEMPTVEEAGARKETTGYNTTPQPHALFLQCFRSFSLPDYSINRIAKPTSVP